MLVASGGYSTKYRGWVHTPLEANRNSSNVSGGRFGVLLRDMDNFEGLLLLLLV